ncbi:hypothetical protein E5288_WYG010122 [Bos mutus]|uniref:Uncharacterized protein n=1 Tax=Bos mutus TaxID=72004 RepID=A0A6B0R7U7_9CETA|nr:hypothetical protein [Bos mutus]
MGYCVELWLLHIKGVQEQAPDFLVDPNLTPNPDETWDSVMATKAVEKQPFQSLEDVWDSFSTLKPAQKNPGSSPPSLGLSPELLNSARDQHLGLVSS